MPAVFVPGLAGMPPDAMPWRYAQGPFSSSNFGPDAQSGIYFVLLGVDITATQDQPVQCWVGLAINGNIFYWDSQSTGEGLGVTFAWRGQILIQPGEHLKADCTSASTIQWGCVMWGYSLPRRGAL